MHPWTMPLTSFRKFMSKSCHWCAKTRLWLPMGLPIIGHDMHVKAKAKAAHVGAKAYAMPLTSFRKIMSK